jgi:hypothetical protein
MVTVRHKATMATCPTRMRGPLPTHWSRVAEGCRRRMLPSRRDSTSLSLRISNNVTAEHDTSSTAPRLCQGARKLNTDPASLRLPRLALALTPALHDMLDEASTTTATNRERSRSPSTANLGEEEEQVHHQNYPERDAKGDFDPYLVRFQPGDPDSPKVRHGNLIVRPRAKTPMQNWSRWQRWYITAQAGQLCFNAYVYLPLCSLFFSF